MGSFLFDHEGPFTYDDNGSQTSNDLTTLTTAMVCAKFIANLMPIAAPNLVLDHMARLTQDLTLVKNSVTKLEVLVENDIAEKIKSIFDSHKQMGEQLNRIEVKVDLHDEIIFKRVK